MLPIDRFPWMASARYAGETTGIDRQFPAAELARTQALIWLRDGYHFANVTEWKPTGRGTAVDRFHRAPRRGDRIVGLGEFVYDEDAPGDTGYGPLAEGVIETVDPGHGLCQLDTGARVHFLRFAGRPVPGVPPETEGLVGVLPALGTFTATQTAEWLGVSESRARTLLSEQAAAAKGHHAEDVLAAAIRHYGLAFTPG